MWVFVDESGCTGMKLGGGSSPNFTLSAVVFSTDAAASAARQAIRVHRAELNWHEHREFKFNRMDKGDRLSFLKMAGRLDFNAHVFVLNKSQLFDGALRKPNQMYSKVVGWVIENAMPSMEGARVVFDSCGNRDFYRFLETYIHDIIGKGNRHSAIVEVFADNSHHNDLLQLADMVSGAVSRYYSDKADSRYYITPIKKRLVNPRFWPSKNDQTRSLSP